MTQEEKKLLLGANLRAARKRRNMTADQLAARMSDQTGQAWSAGTIRKAERGERSILATELIDLAVCLGCDTQTLINGLDSRRSWQEHGAEFRRLTDDEAKIFARIATSWEGDVHALIIFTGLYAALPPQYRREAPLSLLTMMERALRDGAITEADLPEDLEYMERQWRALYK